MRKVQIKNEGKRTRDQEEIIYWTELAVIQVNESLQKCAYMERNNEKLNH